MFQDALIQGNRHIGTKILVFPISAVIHAALATLLVVIPLLHTTALPRFEVRNVFILPALPHLPPPPPPPNRSARSSVRRIKPLRAEPVFAGGKLVAPITIPDAIVEAPVFDVGIEGGQEGGVEGGVPGGILGGVVGSMLGDIIGQPEVPLRIAGEIQTAKLIKQVEPVYPEVARQARVQGVVVLEASTNIFGRVETVRVLQSIPLLDQAAIDAVRQWVYEPMVVNGRPRAVIFTVTVRFHLN